MKKILLVMLVGLFAAGINSTTAQTVRNSSNAYMGKVESDGTIRNSSNAYVGKIQSDGTIRDAQNRVVGTAKGLTKEQAAALFFFNNF